MSEPRPGSQPQGNGHGHGPKTPLDWLMVGLVALAFAVALVGSLLHYAAGP